MSTIRIKCNQTKLGLKWSVHSSEWDSQTKKIKLQKLTPMVFKDLGFTEKMTLSQARDHAKNLNKLDEIKRKEQKQKIASSERLNDLVIKSTALFPERLTNLFVDYIKDNWWGGAYNLKKAILNFSTAQKIVSDLNLLPPEYFNKKNLFYKYFEKQGYSPSYIEKLLKIINQWGEFYSEQTMSYFKKVPNPQGHILEKIKSNTKADGEGATPMTEDIINSVKGMPKGQKEYLYVCFYFGLRPSELDQMIKDNKSWNVTTQGKTPILSVYQGKLSSVQNNRRWKSIPAILPQQVKALSFLTSNQIKKPLVKTIKRALPQFNKIGLYSGRKGFTDLMLDKNQSLENISMWLGHASIDRTWKNYKNKNLIKFDPVNVLKLKKV